MNTLTGVEYIQEAARNTGKINGRFDFVFDRKTEFHHFTLENPHRLVLDFTDVSEIPATRDVGDGLVIRVRFGRPEAGVFRAVFDLERAHPYNISFEENPFRVTVRFSRTLLQLWHEGRLVPMELEDYLTGVVAAEMPALFHVEALRAQAVASRSYAVRRIRAMGGAGCGRHPRADVCSGTHCQAWLSREGMEARWGKDYAKYHEVVSNAVRATLWMVLRYNGKVADTVFHSTCGGQTEDASVVWGNKVPYLQSVPCEYDSHSPYHKRTYALTRESLKEKAGFSQKIIPALQDGRLLLEKKQESDAKTLQEIVVGGKVLSGAEFRRLFELPSLWLEWFVDEITITSKGFGHRVGLCQYGADGYGKNGWSWQQILAHYYRGTELVSLEPAEAVPAKPLPLQGVTVALDPGHGGRTIGAVGPTGRQEKEVVLEIALRLAGVLRESGARVVMTRNSDNTVSLQDRLKIAEQAGAELFVSLHVNGHEKPAAHGTETYYYHASSRPPAERIQAELISALGRYNRGVKQAAFYVLRYAGMPSVLVEIAFITNPEEERLLSDAGFQQKSAEALFSGIKKFLGR